MMIPRPAALLRRFDVHIADFAVSSLARLRVSGP